MAKPSPVFREQRLSIGGHGECVIYHLRKRDGGEVLVMGGSHASADVERIVGETIKLEKPRVVAIELDAERAQQLRPDLFESVEPAKSSFMVIPPSKLQIGFLLAVFSQIFAGASGTTLGAEMSAAMEAASDLGTELTLIDRSARITLGRSALTLRAMAKDTLLTTDEWVAVAGALLLHDRAKLADLASAALGRMHALMRRCVPHERMRDREAFDGLLVKLLRTRTLSPDELDLLQATSAGAIESEVDALQSGDPKLQPAMARDPAVLDERDYIMAHRLYNMHGEKVVAVVGKLHLPGIARLWGTTQEEKANEFEALDPDYASNVITTPLLGAVFASAVQYSLWKSNRRAAIVVAGAVTSAAAAYGVLAYRTASLMLDTMRDMIRLRRESREH